MIISPGIGGVSQYHRPEIFIKAIISSGRDCHAQQRRPSRGELAASPSLVSRKARMALLLTGETVMPPDIIHMHQKVEK